MTHPFLGSVRFRIGAYSYELREIDGFSSGTVDEVSLTLVPRLLLQALAPSAGQGRVLAGFVERRSARSMSGRSEPEELAARITAEVRAGRLRVVRLAHAVVRQDKVVLYPSDPPSLAKAVPPADVPDDPRALFITRCDAELGTSDTLSLSYLIRGLAGRPVRLRIRSLKYAGGILYEWPLPPAETIDRVHDGTWDGIVAVGSHAGKRVSPAFGPCTLEIVHDGTYSDDADFALLDREVVIVEIGGFSFHTDREVLLPDVMPLAADQSGPARAPGVTAAAAVLRFAAQHPFKRMFVAGHTDTVGKQKDNQALSEDRARGVQLYLAGDRDGWAAHSHALFQTEDAQRFLAWASARFGFDCDPGPIDNDEGPLTRAARDAFRAAYQNLESEPLPGDPTPTVDDWKACFTLLDRAVQQTLGEGLDLNQIRQSLEFAEPAFAGFGERFPTDRPDLDSLDSERNRRVDVVFLDAPEASLAGDPTGEDFYGPEAGVKRRYIPLCFAAAEDEIAFRVIDEELGLPISGLELELTTPSGRVIAGQTGNAGEWRSTKLLRGTCALILRSVDAIDWSCAQVRPRELPDSPPPKDTRMYEPEEGIEVPMDITVPEVFDDDED
ncbi:hypothetical protein ACNOYE_04995 [Nannocystaceae bacterium ST9]